MSARLVGDERREVAAALAERYGAGATMQALAAETGRSYTLVRCLLLEAGVRLRPPGLPKGTRLGRRR